jgi:hypothetical protein
MKRSTPKKIEPDESVRTLVVERVGYTAAQQRAQIEAIAHGVEYSNIDDWIASLRAGDRAIVGRLHLIAPPPGAEKTPLTVFNRRIDRVMAARVTLIQAADGVSSEHGEKWLDAMHKARDVIRSGRHMTRREAKKRAEKAHITIKARSAPSRWAAAPEMLRKYRAIWRSLEWSNDTAALHAINEMLHDDGQAGFMIGSWSTARRIFGKRETGEKVGPKPKPIMPDGPSGTVYFIRSGQTRRVKIGFTTHIGNRLNGLKHPLLGKMKVLATIPGTYKTENALHKQFKDYHIDGEWFRLEGELAAYIKSLQETQKRG